jgi:pyruvate kinase
MQRGRQSKIIATVGPSASTEDRLGALFEAGADVFRFNFSHGTHDDHASRLAAVRDIERRSGHPIGVFADLQGPKLRLGNFTAGKAAVAAGASFRLDLGSEPGNDSRAPLPHPEIFAALTPGALLLLDDGKVRLQVEGCGRDFADTRVVVGGTLSDHKGVNLPNVILATPPLTAKDQADLEFALQMGISLIALSFVQRPETIIAVQELIAGRARIIVKLEKPSAVHHLYEIIDLTDAVMVARGDLGVEMPPEEVPSIQKRVIRACRYAGKPVIVATQMLESMVNSPTPTRAEASDVANAVYEGADAVMLSGESAAGRYPVEAVTMMDRIIRRTEQDRPYRNILAADRAMPETTDPDALTGAACDVAETIGAAAIVTVTTTGSTGLRAARERPPVPILALTPLPAVAQILTLAWGVRPVIVPEFARVEEMLQEAERSTVAAGLVRAGDRIVVAAALPLGTPGQTNTLHIVQVTARPA